MHDDSDEFEVNTNPIFIARIKRETGMALLRQATSVTDLAHREIIMGQVAALFSESYALICKDPDADIESAVTLSYMGQQLLLGGDQDGAFRFMEEADTLLRAGYNPLQELDNLLWLIRAAEPSKRRSIHRRIKSLLQLTNQMERRTEIKLFMIGGDRLLSYVGHHPILHRTINRLYRK